MPGTDKGDGMGIDDYLGMDDDELLRAFESRSQFQIEDMDGAPYVHVNGYIYQGDGGGDGCDWGQLEYTFCYFAVADALDRGFAECESEYGEAVQQYVSDLTEDDAADAIRAFLEDGWTPVTEDMLGDLGPGRYYLVEEL